MHTAASVIRDLKKHGSRKKSKTSARFFKTDKGQYGHGDIFIGVAVPDQRKVAKRYTELTLSEIRKLLRNPIHEYRLTALIILSLQYMKGSKSVRARIAHFYLANRTYVNNWDLVDASSPQILGSYLLEQDRSMLRRLARSRSLWDKRVAIVATYAFIRAHQYDDTFTVAEILMHDSHDLIHKAVGWMLREVGKRDQKAEEAFLKKHAVHMPRTMLRYAIERFPEKKRTVYLSMRRVS